MSVIIEVTVAATTSKQDGNKIFKEKQFHIECRYRNDFFFFKNSNASTIHKKQWPKMRNSLLAKIII